MNHNRLMAALAATNPVTELPAVPPAAHIHERVAGTPPTTAPARAAGHAPKHLNRLAFAGPLCAALAVGVLILLMGSSQPRLDVLASAYAATSPTAGVLEAVFQSTTRTGGEDTTFEQHEWVDTQTHQIRELITKSSVAGGTEITDRVSSPGIVESWSNAYEPSVIRRELTTYTPRSTAWGFGGLQLEGLGGTDLFRALYRAGKIQVVGRIDLHGEQLWKLQSSTTTIAGRPHTRLVVLLDPHTFLPSSQILLNVSNPRRLEVLTTSRLSTYRHLRTAVNSNSNTLFNLSAQHSGTTLHTRAGRFPVFRSLHPGEQRPRLP